MGKTKFKVGDQIKIVSHKNIKKIGLTGVISEVIPVFKNSKDAEDAGYLGKFSVDENTTAFYKISIGSKKLKGYGMDRHIELFK